MKKKTSNRRLIFQLAAVVVLIAIAYAMTIIGRGHTVYFDNRALDKDGQSVAAPYKITVYVNGEQISKLYDKERGSTTCLGQTFTVALTVMEKKNGTEETQTYKIPVPKNMDGVILNIPGYLAGLPQEAYITEFVPAVTEEPVDDEVPGGEDDLIPGTDGDSAIPDM